MRYRLHPDEAGNNLAILLIKTKGTEYAEQILKQRPKRPPVKVKAPSVPPAAGGGQR